MANLNETTLIGRKDELETLVSELTLKHASRQPIKLFHLKGKEGIGKKYICTEALKTLQTDPDKRLFLSIPSIKQTHWEDLAEVLLAEITTSHAEQADELQLFQNEYLLKTKELSSELPENETLSSDLKIELWMEAFLSHFVYEDKGSHLQILFYLPDFELWTKENHSIFTRIIASPLARRFNSPDTRFVISSSEDTASFIDFKNIWRNNERSVRILDLPPFKLPEVQKWVEQEELPLGISARLLKESHGIPGQLQDISEKILDEENLGNWIRVAERILAGSTAEEIKTIAEGLLLPEITQETLRIFHPTEELAEKAYKLIKNKEKLNAVEAVGTLQIRKEVTRAITRWYKNKQTEAYKEAYTKAAQLKIPLLHLDTKLARDVLTSLSAFTFFNTDVLKEVFPDQSKEIIDFTAIHHRFFERSAGNYKITQTSRKALDNYLALTNRKAPEEILQKMDACWHKTREKILTEIRTTEEKIEKDESSLNQLKQDIRKLNKSIQNEEDTIERLQKLKNKPIQKIIKKNNNGLSILLAISGTVILYFSILFTENISIAYAISGVLCLFAGIFLQSQTSTVSVPVPAQASAHINTEKYDKNMHFMSLKKNQLHQQISSATSTIQRSKDQLKEYDNLLRQPY